MKFQYSSLKAAYEKMMCDEVSGELFEAQATVFELRLHKTFASWRDTTVFVQLQVSVCQYDGDGDRRDLNNDLFRYDALARYHASPLGPRYRCVQLDNRIAAHIERLSQLIFLDVCLNNGMRYHFFDAAISTRSNISRRKLYDTMLRACTYKLEGNALNKYLYRPFMSPKGLPSNTSEAPDHISISEFKSLCSLPSGSKLQWQNILLQLSMPEVDFRKPETSFVLWQAMYQAGPISDATAEDGLKGNRHLRQSHFIVNDDLFCHELVNRLRQACGRVKQNWESCQALANFAAVAARVLSLSCSPAVHTACLDFLSEARQTAFAWLEKLKTVS
ncbi:hypothetical protein PspLS_09900 [Pyricularia sp. CBS 133598]|nr:hypothetical protein PspLS_09900 [Pyricularia sp. CBS 133598]